MFLKISRIFNTGAVKDFCCVIQWRGNENELAELPGNPVNLDILLLKKTA